MTVNYNELGGMDTVEFENISENWYVHCIQMLLMFLDYEFIFFFDSG